MTSPHICCQILAFRQLPWPQRWALLPAPQISSRWPGLTPVPGTLCLHTLSPESLTWICSFHCGLGADNPLGPSPTILLLLSHPASAFGFGICCQLARYSLDTALTILVPTPHIPQEVDFPRLSWQAVMYGCAGCALHKGFQLGA